MSLMCSSFFLRRRTRVNATVAVEADVRIVPYVHVLVVNIVKVAAHMPNRCVIEEMPTFPTSAIEAVTEVTETIVDPAIKPYSGTPIAVIEHKPGAAPTPVGRGPQDADFRSHYPSARDPVIVGGIVVIIPVSRRPKITVAGANRLLVNGQDRRPYRNRHADLSGHRPRYAHQQYCEQHRSND